jgi:hypothetical protein
MGLRRSKGLEAVEGCGGGKKKRPTELCSSGTKPKIRNKKKR